MKKPAESGFFYDGSESRSVYDILKFIFLKDVVEEVEGKD